MPSKKVKTEAAKLEAVEDEASILAPPQDSNSDSDGTSADIQPTSFTSSKSVEFPDTDFTRQLLGQRNTVTKPSIRNTRTSAAKSSRITSRGSKPGSSNPGSPKRKSRENNVVGGTGNGKEDDFGNLVAKKRHKTATKYTTKTQSTAFSKAGSSRTYGNGSTTSSKIKLHEIPDEDGNSPAKVQSKKNSFRHYSNLDSSPEKPRVPKQKFVVHDMSELEDTPMKVRDVNASKLRVPLGLVESPDARRIPSARSNFDSCGLDRELTSQDPLEETLATIKKKFQLPESFNDILTKDIDRAHKKLPIEDDVDFDPTISRCPMCNRPVDKKLLKSAGNMNIRQQERFCMSHKQTTALDEWDDKGYPNIDWEDLDSRITQHHDFIEALIRGQDSHYRQILADIVEAGTDRNLLKSTGNLTPGYYGPRGSRAISENIGDRFNDLLNEMALEDHVIRARGRTHFVQSVLVFEVATRFIVEDMEVDESKARDILTESARLGDMVNEEIKDVVVEMKVDDSDGEDSDDETNS